MTPRFGVKEVARMIAEGQNKYLDQQRQPKVVCKVLFVDHMEESRKRQSSCDRLFSLIALRCRSALQATSARSGAWCTSSPEA